MSLTARTSDVAFSDATKAVQEARGSRSAFARRADWPSRITPELTAFIAEIRSFFLATASADGQPYMQHRGGPPGFLKVVDETTLAFADFKGNRQFISTGNLSENPKAFIFIMEYASRQRIKLWGRARVVRDDPALLERLWPTGYEARPEQVIIFDLAAYDSNCPQHIPQMFHAEDVARTLATQAARITDLEAENEALRAAIESKS